MSPPPGGPPPFPQPFPPASDLAQARLHKAVQDAGRKVVDAGAKVEKLADRFDVFHQELALLRAQLLGDVTPPFALQRPVTIIANPDLPPDDADPLRPVRFASSKTAARWVLMAVGVLGIAVQIASTFRPGLVAPLQTLLDLINQFAN